MRNKLAKQLRQYVRDRLDLGQNLFILDVCASEYEFLKVTNNRGRTSTQVRLREDSPRKYYKALKKHVTKFGI